jgi:hypothetical protein
VLSSAACAVPRLVGLSYDVHSRGRPEGAAEQRENIEARDLWDLVILPVVDYLCLLSAQVVTASSARTSNIDNDDDDDEEGEHGTAAAVANRNALYACIGRTPSAVCPRVGVGCGIIAGWFFDSEDAEDERRATARSCGWSAWAVRLKTLLGRQGRNEVGGGDCHALRRLGGAVAREGQGSAIEAVEHALNIWGSCVAAARRVGGGGGVALVSPAVSAQYVMLLRQVSSDRGACTARARFLMNASLNASRSGGGLAQQVRLVA